MCKVIAILSFVKLRSNDPDVRLLISFDMYVLSNYVNYRSSTLINVATNLQISKGVLNQKSRYKHVSSYFAWFITIT